MYHYNVLVKKYNQISQNFDTNVNYILIYLFLKYEMMLFRVLQIEKGIYSQYSLH